MQQRPAIRTHHGALRWVLPQDLPVHQLDTVGLVTSLRLDSNALAAVNASERVTAHHLQVAACRSDGLCGHMTSTSAPLDTYWELASIETWWGLCLEIVSHVLESVCGVSKNFCVGVFVMFVMFQKTRCGFQKKVLWS